MKNEKFKMQNLLLVLLVLIIGWGIFARPALAQESLEFEVAETAGEKVEYSFPYPGILPDHPLYRLKMIRDRIWGFLIRDPLKKAEWCLLMADKRIWAAQMLIEKGKFDLAVSTATKAEKYLERAVSRTYQAETMGKGDKVFFEKIAKACLKHEEVLKEVSQKIPEDLKPVIEKILEYPRNAREKILRLLP